MNRSNQQPQHRSGVKDRPRRARSTSGGAARTSGGVLTTYEVATQLRITQRQVRQLIRTGKLAAVNVSTGESRPVWRVQLRDLVKFKREQASNKRQMAARRRRRRFQADESKGLAFLNQEIG